MASTQVARVAIVGAGFAGSITAAQLLRQARGSLDVLLIERRFPVGSGRAFANTLPCHLLNVPAIRMSAYPDDPQHLIRWVGPVSGENAFLPRSAYGAYVAATLSEAEQGSPARLIRMTGEAVAIEMADFGARLRLGDGSAHEVDHVVVAVGNPPPLDPPGTEEVRSSPRYAPDPWGERALRDLTADGTVVAIGSNLTMIDVALALHHHGHRGPLLAISTHGLLPQAHARTLPEPWTSKRNGDGRGPREVMSELRHETTAAKKEGFEWRSVVDSLRSRIPSLWASWSDAQRRRFLRHARPYWEVHRHRMAPENAATIGVMMRSGRLRVAAGRIVSARDTPGAIEISLLRRGASRPETIPATRLVNCTGPGMDFRRSRDPLLQDLFARGLAKPGPLGLGFDADPDGALRGVEGRSSILSTLGPPLKGLYWETTAVPEIRIQAQALAQRLARLADSRETRS
jgi:uncharacterized NAD(P)/FAD-binding protein YdhS